MKRFPSFLFLVFLSPAIFAQATNHRPLPSPSKPRITGRVEMKKGVPFVFLWGSNESRGFAEGYLRGEAILSSFRSWVLERINPLTWDLVVVPTAHRRFQFPKRFLERSKAILSGMKAKGKTFVPELKRELTSRDLCTVSALIDARGLLCSSIAAWGKQVKGGGPIVCRNLDYSASARMLKEQCVFIQAPYEDRAGSISVGWSSAWLVTGISDRGVFLAIHDVPAKAIRGRANTPRIVALWEVLERLQPSRDTWKSAGRLLGKFDFAYGGNAMLAFSGSNPGAGILEFGPRKGGQPSVTIRRSENGSWIACTNHWRARSPSKGRWRYRAIEKKANQMARGRSLFDSAAVWEIASKARVKRTLHTILVDFGTGLIDLDMRLIPQEDRWVSLRHISIKHLFSGLPNPRAQTR